MGVKISSTFKFVVFHGQFACHWLDLLSRGTWVDLFLVNGPDEERERERERSGMILDYAFFRNHESTCAVYLPLAFF